MRRISASLETQYSPAGKTLLPTLNANGITKDWRSTKPWPNAETDANASTIAKVIVTLKNVAFIFLPPSMPPQLLVNFNSTLDNAESEIGLGQRQWELLRLLPKTPADITR